MKIFRGFTSLPNACTVAIGNFDGMHLGHQALLAAVKAQAKKYDVPSAVMTFEPQPLEFFTRSESPMRIMRLQDKALYCQQAGIDYLIVVPFTKAFAAKTPAEFIALLEQSCGAKAVVVGDDFRFGAKRAGDVETLKQGKFELQVIDEQTYNGERISSTRIRQALQDNQLDLAVELLGHPYTLAGRVTYGNQFGRKLGFPTINIKLKPKQVEITGIFAARVTALSRPSPEGASRDQISDRFHANNEGSNHWVSAQGRDRTYYGAANLGIRPAIEGNTPWLEVNLFDFDGDLYGRRVQVELLHKLHDEKHYADMGALKVGIAEDVKDIKAWFDDQVKLGSMDSPR